MKNKKAWIRIVEAFVAILLITGFLLISLNQEYIRKKDFSREVYDIELAILREIQLDDELRFDILNIETPPVEWEDDNFPVEIKDKISNRLPSYLDCRAKICTLNELCMLDEVFEKDVYAQSISVLAGLKTYNPRQLKLFCWMK